MRAHNTASLRACGQEFRLARIARGLSRQDLADAAGVHLNTISNVERGEQDINILTQTKLLATIGCTAVSIEKDRNAFILGDDPIEFPHRRILEVPSPLVVRLIGSAVRERRLDCGVSIAELGRMTGLHKNTIWSLESGLMSPNGLTLHAIYSALGVVTVSVSPHGVRLLHP